MYICKEKTLFGTIKQTKDKDYEQETISFADSRSYQPGIISTKNILCKNNKPDKRNTKGTTGRVITRQRNGCAIGCCYP